jgi:hypothetical protein
MLLKTLSIFRIAKLNDSCLGTFPLIISLIFYELLVLDPSPTKALGIWDKQNLSQIFDNFSNSVN